MIGARVTDALKEIGQPFGTLLRVPRAVWGLYLSYLLEGMAYFGILTELTLYFPENLGLSHHHAGIVVGFFTCAITLAQSFLGAAPGREWAVRARNEEAPSLPDPRLRGTVASCLAFAPAAPEGFNSVWVAED